MTETDDARMVRLGVENEDLSALRTLWSTTTLRPLLSENATGMQVMQCDPLDALDIAWHRSDYSAVASYLRRGFTPHQAHLLLNSERATGNLFGDTDGDTDKYDQFLDAPILRDILTELLLVAHSQSEAQQFINQVTDPAEESDQPSDDRESVSIEALTTISSRSTTRTDRCDCREQP